MSEFVVNDFITLRLEDEKTNIYILGEKFIQCKYLLLDIPVQDFEKYDEIDSIDEASEKLDKSLEQGNLEAFKIKIRPEVEFWGHCSNLQVWAEQNYDTRFIHSNLAFPLLKKLTEVGDLKARKIFKEEIGKRFEKGSDSGRQFLALGRYLDFLSREEMWSVMPNQSEAKTLREIEKETETEFKLCSDEQEFFTWGEKPNQLAFSLKNGYVKKVDLFNFKKLSALKWEKIFVMLGKLIALKELYLSHNNIRRVLDSVKFIKSLEVLKMNHNELEEIPEEVGDMENLIWLIFNNNKIKTIPESIGKLRLIKELRLDHNQLKELPNSIGNLKFLEKLFLNNNFIEKLPDSVIGMESLVQFVLNNNLLSDLPEKMIEMKSLKGIGIVNNKIKKNLPIINLLLKKKGVNIIME